MFKIFKPFYSLNVHLTDTARGAVEKNVAKFMQNYIKRKPPSKRVLGVAIKGTLLAKDSTLKFNNSEAVIAAEFVI